MEQTPIEDILHLATQKPGSYTLEFPRSVCFGLVTLGGLLVSVSYKACKQFISQNQKSKNHLGLLQSSVRYFRPVLASPRKAHVQVRMVHTGKAFTNLHVELSQDGKTCMVGYFTFTDMNAPGPVSALTHWELLPPPLWPSINALEADEDPRWVSYQTPFSPGSIRNPHSYVKYHVPVERQHHNYVDQWVTPAWEDKQRPGGAVWTNELIHFILDNHFFFWPNYLPTDVVAYCRYEDQIAAGLEQRQARKEGRDDRIFGENCGPSGPLNWMGTSISSSVEIKKLLPSEGTKWLFMRTYSCKFANNRFDEQIYLLDTRGELIAICNDTMHLVPAVTKTKDRKAKM